MAIPQLQYLSSFSFQVHFMFKLAIDYFSKSTLRAFCAVFALFSIFASATALAGTIVRVSTSVGDYSIELLDESAPLTVANFLGYVDRNDFNGTYLHRVVDNFVVQGGAYRFKLFEGPIDIPVGEPVVNEFGASNVRGTVAMAKVDGDPDSATNQWFVNLADNSANLDGSNGGFTVFGTVLGDGMAVLDAIDALPFVSLGAKATNAPYFSEFYENPTSFVYMNVEVTERFSSAAHVYESGTGLLITSVNIDNGSDIVSLNFSSVASDLGFVIQANQESVIPRQAVFDGIATFDSAAGLFTIPSLEVNLNGSVSVISNVVFKLIDPARARFLLDSYEQN
jgi:peptidyl-prolyl cis-trans isomerase A (cyclophilin A)